MNVEFILRKTFKQALIKPDNLVAKFILMQKSGIPKVVINYLHLNLYNYPVPK
jgi:hypothetical protein